MNKQPKPLGYRNCKIFGLTGWGTASCHRHFIFGQVGGSGGSGLLAGFDLCCCRTPVHRRACGAGVGTLRLKFHYHVRSIRFDWDIETNSVHVPQPSSCSLVNLGRSRGVKKLERRDTHVAATVAATPPAFLRPKHAFPLHQSPFPLNRGPTTCLFFFSEFTSSSTHVSQGFSNIFLSFLL